MPLCICNTELRLAYSTKAVKNYRSAGAITVELRVYFCELLFPCYEVFDLRDIRKAKGD
jgi:hypothetical protein